MSFLVLRPWCLLLLVLALGFWLQRRYEGALRAQQHAAAVLSDTTMTLARMRQSIESASDAIGIGDREGTSLYHNRAHLEMFGYTVAELNAVPDTGVLFADKIVAAAIHAAIRGGYS